VWAGEPRARVQQQEAHGVAARTCTDGAEARQGRGECGPGNRRRRRSCVERRRAERQRARQRRAAHSGVSARCAQAAAGSVCGEVTRGAGGAIARRLQADPHGGSETARGGRRRPLNGKQRMRSSGTADCSRRIWRWPRCDRASVLAEAEGASVARLSEGGGPG
jgi:hypothetical protein